MDLFDENTAQLRLNGSVIQVGDMFILVRGVDAAEGRRFRVRGNRLPDMRDVEFFWPDEQINLANLQLGMVNIRMGRSKQTRAYYFTRMPARIYKAGLTPNNCIGFMVKQEPTMEAEIGGGALFEYMPAFNRCLKKDYPRPQIQEGQKYPIAFSKDFARGRTNGLYYRNLGKVGKFISRDSLRYRLNDNFTYLAEVLDGELRKWR